MNQYLFIILFSLTLCSLSLSAQNTGTEVLEDKIKKTEDPREKMGLFYQLSEKYTSANIQKASLYAHQACSIVLYLGDDTRTRKYQ